MIVRSVLDGRPAAPVAAAAQRDGEHDPLRWTDLFEGAPAVLEVLADWPRPRGIERSVATHSRPLGARRTRLLRTAEAAHLSVADVVLAAWAAVVARHAEQTEIVIGDISGAPDRVSPTRWHVAHDTTAADLLGQRADALGAPGGVAAVSMDEVNAALGAEPNDAKHPSFQVGFASLAEAADGARIGADRFVPCDLVLALVGDDSLSLQCPTVLYGSDRIERMLTHVMRVIDAIADEPEVVVSRIPLVDDAEAAQIAAWNATAAPLDGEATLASLVAEQARTTPDAVAVEFEGASLTYAALQREAVALADALRAVGVRRDARVAVSVERSLEMIIALVGVLESGGAYVPVDPAYPQARRDYMLADADVAAVVTRGPDGALRIDASPNRADASIAPTSSGPAGAALAYVIYTSGSTGQPKGVAVPHGAAVNLLRWQLQRPEFAHAARVLQFTSLSFDVSVQEIFSTLASGGTLVVVRDEIRRNPLTLLDAIVEQHVERLFLPFVALRGLAHAACTTSRFPTSLREVYTAGEQLQADDTLRSFFAALPGAVLENQYGPTEAAVIVTAHRLGRSPAAWEALPPIGSPIANVRCRILDRNLETQPIGVAGDLYLTGACLAREYLGKPELTAERFVELVRSGFPPERAYRTGDLARWRSDGAIEFLGRNDNQVKFRGYRIEPGEVGAALSNHPDVEHCVATIREIEGSGPRLVAYVKAASPSLDLEALHRFARAALPEHMVPSHLAVVDDFPHTPSGKLDLQALPTPAFNRDILGVGFRQPRTVTEIRLSAIWSRLLGVEKPGTDDDFFALGGDSLMAVEMFAHIRAELGRELPLGALAAAPTIAQLAAKLDAVGQDDWSVVVPLQTRGTKRPLFCVHGGSGNVATFPLLARALPEDQPFYALQWDGLSGRLGTRTIRGMAELYAREIRSVQPHGPYLLAGQCAGGLIAQEMANVLLADGESVDLLVMYDPPNVGSPHHVQPSLREEIVRFWRDPGRRTRARDGFGMARRHALVRLQRRVGTDFRHLYAVDMLCRATAAHRPSVAPVPTLLFSTGETNASLVGLRGRWVDDAFGWSSAASPRFRIHLVEGGHTEIMYSGEATAVVRDALARVHDCKPALDDSPASTSTPSTSTPSASTTSTSTTRTAAART